MPRKYDMVMVVDIDGVGQDMFSLPIKAESEVPLVKIEPMKQLNFGTIFLRNPDV
jgi:hydrocephalus-inducing protein